MRLIVDEHLRFVTRTLQKAGVPRCDVDDEVQRTFMVVAGRLEDVKLGAERSFLFQVAINMAAHARRKLARRREILSDRIPERIDTLATPDRMMERKQARQMLDNVLRSMPESMRVVFTLYELEGMDRVEIAAQLGVPRGTVASRLRRARAQFRKNVVAVEFAADVGAKGASTEAPAPLRRQKVGRLWRALRNTGASIAPANSTHARTLAVLGLTASAA
jgi:RNA polymerase sigma-70 factor (ECF subfamily)